MDRVILNREHRYHIGLKIATKNERYKPGTIKEECHESAHVVLCVFLYEGIYIPFNTFSWITDLIGSTLNIYFMWGNSFAFEKITVCEHVELQH